MDKRTLDAETIKRLRQHVIIIHDTRTHLWAIEVASSRTRLEMQKSGVNSWTVVYSDLYPHAPLFGPLKALLIEAAEAETSGRSTIH